MIWHLKEWKVDREIIISVFDFDQHPVEAKGKKSFIIAENNDFAYSPKPFKRVGKCMENSNGGCFME